MKNFSLLFVILLLSYCTSDVLEHPVKKKQVQKEDKVGQAIDFLNGAFLDNEIEGAASGSAVAPKTVNLSKASIDTIYDLPDENNKPFLQLVVFKPKAYAVVSVIKNVPNPPVLFYSQSKFNVKKPDIGLITYLKQFLANARRVKDLGGPDNVHGFITYKTILSRSTTTQEVKSLMTTEWHQDKPYNNTVVKKEGVGIPVGCTAVAAGQIMAYHKKNNLKTYNWNLILKSDDASIKSNGGVADFLWDIGKGVKMQYATSGSGAHNIDVQKYFNCAGYKTTFSNYDFGKVVTELKNKRPVYLAACAKEIKIYNGFWRDLFGNPYTYIYDDCHAWVTDGYKIICESTKYLEDKVHPVTGQVAYSSTYTESKTTRYLYMNWGWKSGPFTPDYSKHLCTYDYWKIDRYNFKYKQQMMTVKK